MKLECDVLHLNCTDGIGYSLLNFYRKDWRHSSKAMPYSLKTGSVEATTYSSVAVNPTYSDLPKVKLSKARDVEVVVNYVNDPGHFYVALSGKGIYFK